MTGERQVNPGKDDLHFHSVPLVGIRLLERLQRSFHLALFKPAVRQMDARFRNVRRFVNDMLKNPLGLFELAKGYTANAKQIQCIIVRIMVLEELDIGIMRGLELTGKLEFHDLRKRKGCCLRFEHLIHRPIL